MYSIVSGMKGCESTFVWGCHRYRPLEELREAFKAVGVDEDSAIITTCGSGVTACILVLALQQIYPDKQVCSPCTCASF